MVTYEITNPRWYDPTRYEKCFVSDCDMIGCLTTSPKKKKKFYVEDEKSVEAILKKFNYEYIKNGKSEKKPKQVSRKKGD